MDINKLIALQKDYEGTREKYFAKREAEREEWHNFCQTAKKICTTHSNLRMSQMIKGVSVNISGDGVSIARVDGTTVVPDLPLREAIYDAFCKNIEEAIKKYEC